MLSAPTRIIKLVVGLALSTSVLYDQIGRLCQMENMGAWLYWPSYLGYFIAAYWLARREYHNIPAFCLLPPIVALGVVIDLGVAGLFPVLGARSWPLMYSYLNHLVVLMSLGVFCLVLDHANKIPARLLSVICWLAPTTLGIYVIHPLMLGSVISRFGIQPFLLHPIIGISLTTMATFVLSAVFVYAVQRVPVIRRVMG